MEIRRLQVGQLATSCYILKTKKEVFIIDPGGNAEEIAKHIENQKVTIINTHYHFDHTASNEYLKKKFNAKVLIHEDEKEFIDFKADDFLKNEDVLKINNHELKVLHTPGHSEGSICLLAKDYIITGDTLFDGGYGRTDLPGGNNEKMLESLTKLQKKIKTNMTVYPGHGEPFTWENSF